MSAPLAHTTPRRHPWLTQFERAPEESFGELLAGYADIHPYERADAPDAARAIFGMLDRNDPARQSLGLAIRAWLARQRRIPLPVARPKLQRCAREVSEALEIVAILDVAEAALDLRMEFFAWNEWVTRLVISSARDARAEYWRTLALTQGLVAGTAQAVDVNGLAPFWQRICREAGGRLPKHYLSIGLLGLRRLPLVNESTELAWVSGLAQWALERSPSEGEFKAEWYALKPLYPRSPAHWQKLILRLLSSPTFEDHEPPAWWAVDPDFAPLARNNAISTDARLRSPLPADCDRVIARLAAKGLEDAEPTMEILLDGHRKYVHATGDSQYLVRAAHALGVALIGEKLASPERARRAQSLAREGLKWEPYNRYLWSLWRDALASEGTLDAAELVGWEFIRRDPANPDARTQLALLLATSLDRFDEAERLLKETIEKFPDNEHAYNQLAELLIAEDRTDEAAAIVDAALEAAATARATYAVRARLYSHEGKAADALRMVTKGLEHVGGSDRVLKEFRQRLSQGDELPLKSQAFRRLVKRTLVMKSAAIVGGREIAALMRLGMMRRLRFQLEIDTQNRETAVEKLRQILREDPTFAYAELLAARHHIWKAQAGILPSFAAAFEEALASEDREKLMQLAVRQPRLSALILVAQALFGDVDAAQRIEEWLRSSEAIDTEVPISGLRSRLRPVRRSVEGGRAIGDALSELRESVIKALQDANEAALGDALQAA